MTATERSGFRDERLSRRHRFWGEGCPAVDADFILAEYNHKVPVALIDYKAKAWSFRDWDANLGTLTELANGYRDGIPFFVVSYSSDTLDWFKVYPINEKAQEKLDGYDEMCPLVLIEEKRYVAFLYWLRGRKTPQPVVDDIQWLRDNPACGWEAMTPTELRRMRRREPA